MSSELPGIVCLCQPAEGRARTDGFERLHLQLVYPVSARFPPSKSVGTSSESLDLSDDSLISLDHLGTFTSARTYGSRGEKKIKRTLGVPRGDLFSIF